MTYSDTRYRSRSLIRLLQDHLGTLAALEGLCQTGRDHKPSKRYECTGRNIKFFENRMHLTDSMARESLSAHRVFFHRRMGDTGW